MRLPTELYRPSLALLTDLYQLTMAAGYWKSGTAERDAVFHLTFRNNPFGSGFTVACGLDAALEYIRDFHFDEADLAYLRQLPGPHGRPLFEPAFVDYLARLRLSLDVDAIPEGTVVFPHEPLLRVRGPVLQCQLLETALLNAINFQTLVATKAARVKLAAGDEPVLEFGLRRAQGIDGALSASRAAWVGGCDATSNVLAGRLFGIPVKGTHAHSWVMVFPDELQAFRAYAEALPDNCLFLVDTYDTLEGVRHAIEVGRELRAKGHDLLGIRLDSGDLAYLSVTARKMLDEAGFPKASIVASNDLDEHLIESLKQQGALIDTWGVGTRLVTAFDQPALGGVYKLSMVKGADGSWQHRLKLSEQAVKISTPGVLQVRRFERNGESLGDAIWDETLGCPPTCTIVDPVDITRRKVVPRSAPSADLLVPAVRGGRVVYQSPPLEEVRARLQQQLARLHPTIKRFVNPHQYPVGLEKGLHDLKMRLVLAARGVEG